MIPVFPAPICMADGSVIDCAGQPFTALSAAWVGDLVGQVNAVLPFAVALVAVLVIAAGVGIGYILAGGGK